MIVSAVIVRGKIVWDNPDEYFLMAKTFEGKKVQVEIRKAKRRRSIPQNNYYWGVVLQLLGADLGYSSEEAHEAMVRMFLEVPNDDLEIPSTFRKTSDLSTVEFEEYLEKIRRWAAEFRGLFIPDPQQTFFDYRHPKLRRWMPQSYQTLLQQYKDSIT